MSTPMRLVAAIAVVLLAGVAAFNLLGSSPGVGGAASPSPTVAPSTPAPTPTPALEPTPYAIDTATWTAYPSSRYGFSIGHPADWVVHTTASRDWKFPADANADPYSPAVETFLAANGDVAASAWSVAVKPGTTAGAWVQAYCAVAESNSPCTARQVPVSMDGHAGSLVRFTEDTQAFILVGDRMYVVAIWQPEDFIPGGVSRLLEAYLSTMHLLPAGPVPTAASGSTGPGDVVGSQPGTITVTVGVRGLGGAVTCQALGDGGLSVLLPLSDGEAIALVFGPDGTVSSLSGSIRNVVWKVTQNPQGSLNADHSGTFSGKDAISGADVSGTFACK